MEFKVEHPHFVENKITWEISGLKSTLKYNGEKQNCLMIMELKEK